MARRSRRGPPPRPTRPCARSASLGVTPTSHVAVETGGPVYTVQQMGSMAGQTVKALATLPVKVYGVGEAIVGVKERCRQPGQVVGGGRLAERLDRVAGGLPVVEKTCSVHADRRLQPLHPGLFNFIPLLPLDGGHIAGALWEAVRRGFARLRGRPDPGYVDVAGAAADRLLRRQWCCLVMGVVLIVGDLVVPPPSSPKVPVATEINPRHARGPPPVLARDDPPARSRSAGGRRERLPDLGPVDDDDAHRRRQHHAPADRRADRGRLRHRAGGLPEPGRRRGAARDRPALQILVIADIHFQPKYVFAAIDAGCAAVRVNPGNIRQFDDQVKEIAAAAKDRGTLDPDRRQRRAPWTSGSSRSTARQPRGAGRVGGVGASLFEEHDFHDFKISVANTTTPS